MLVVALLLLPVMGLLLIGMDRVEDRLNGEGSPPSGRHRRHLRLVSSQERLGSSQERLGRRKPATETRRDEAA
ncbi:hypothetical protein ABZS76_07060 [Streptomyces sp. NPDC005562]|uniref:hypothetical protein n=1 Tax=unclassified Streptomyces TaxID=2593676 RepID=UPI00339E3313